MLYGKRQRKFQKNDIDEEEPISVTDGSGDEDESDDEQENEDTSLLFILTCIKI